MSTAMTDGAGKMNCLNVPKPGGETNETFKSAPGERDNSRDIIGTISLKALALRNIERRKARDGSETNTIDPAALDAASDLAFAASERAALVGEGEFGNAAAPVPHRLPPAWSDARIEPTPGAVCYSCRRRNWWCEAVNPSGWRCGTCRPPIHLSAGQFREVET